jgi:hypothetical protein
MSDESDYRRARDTYAITAPIPALPDTSLDDV